MIRVGRIRYNKGSQDIPEYKGFTPIMVMTQSSEYGALGPYVLCDDQGRNMENRCKYIYLYDYLCTNIFFHIF